MLGLPRRDWTVQLRPDTVLRTNVHQPRIYRTISPFAVNVFPVVRGVHCVRMYVVRDAEPMNSTLTDIRTNLLRKRVSDALSRNIRVFK